MMEPFPFYMGLIRRKEKWRKQQMKRIMITLLALAVLTGTGSALSARGMGNGGCSGYGLGMNGGPGYHGMMFDDLKLTEEQELKIHKINKDYADKFFEARKDRDAHYKVRENHRKEIEKILTKEQLEKLKDFRGAHQGKGKGMRQGKERGKPGMMHNYLEITDEQAEKIHKLNMEFHDKMFKNRNNEKEMDKLRENHLKEFQKILTKQQLEKFNSFQKHHRGLGFGPGFGGMW
jgi:Spy/CpxP family protein refolding chaperone